MQEGARGGGTGGRLTGDGWGSHLTMGASAGGMWGPRGDSGPHPSRRRTLRRMVQTCKVRVSSAGERGGKLCGLNTKAPAPADRPAGAGRGEAHPVSRRAAGFARPASD